MATNDDEPASPTPASGEPRAQNEKQRRLVDDDAQIALVGDTPDAEAQRGAPRPEPREPDADS